MRTGKKKSALRPLTRKERLFVSEYLKDGNGSQAAIRAGYSVNGARTRASELLTRSNIRDALLEAGERVREKVEIDAAWMLKRLALISEAKLADLYAEDGTLKPVAEWPDIWQQGLVAGVDVVEERGRDGESLAIVRKVKLADRVRVLELIGKHVDVGAWRERMDVVVTDSRADRLARARERER